MAEIGKINKPEAALYKNKKKIYFLTNLFLPPNATDIYKSIFDRYWKEVGDHLDKLEIAGKVSKIFCESIYMTGEKSMKVLNAMNPMLSKIVQKKIDAGGKLLPLESQDIFGAYIDWNNCHMVVRTPKVDEIIHKYLKEAVRERFEYIKSVLKENIAEGEAILLIMREEDREFLKLPEGIELFSITPPAYDDLNKFIRDSKSEKEYWRS